MTPLHPFERMTRDVVDDAAFNLEQLFRPRVLQPKRCMGVRVIHKPVLDLREYIAHVVEAPVAVHRQLPPGDDAWLNTDLGDCGEAMTLNGVQAFDSETGRPITPFVDDDAEKWYEIVGNYVPGNPATDQGTDNNVLVAKWKDPGLLCSANGSVHKIVESLFVDPADENLTKLAIWEFVVNFRAYALPNTAQSQTMWSIVGDGKTGDSAPASWGYHDIAQTSYGPKAVGLKSWGQPYAAHWGFDTHYGVQGFVVTTPEQTNLQGISPAGIDWTKLNADLGKLPSAGN